MKAKIAAVLKKVTDIERIKRNVRSNWLLLLSSLALILMQRPLEVEIKYLSVTTIAAQVGFTVLIQLAVFSLIPSVLDKTVSAPLYVKILSVLSALGMCCYEIKQKTTLVIRHKGLIRVFAARNWPDLPIDLCMLMNFMAVVLSILSVIVVYALTVHLFMAVADVWKDLIGSLTYAEQIVYACIALTLIGFGCFSFVNGGAFWGMAPFTDVLFTSDSSNLVGVNAYMYLMHSENDIRQPLFAVFAAPFVGIGYAVGFPFSFISPVVIPLFMNTVQIIMLAAGHLMLAKTVCSDSRSRICLMLLLSVTYTTLLFSLMMEQYVVVYFWLMFAIYLSVRDNRASELSVVAAGGTLLTGLALLPLAYDFHRKGDWIKPFLKRMAECLAFFLVLTMSFGRINVITTAFQSTKALSRFAGGRDFLTRIRMYISFISSCFAAPETRVMYYGFHSYQLLEPAASGVSVLGLIILLACLLSFWLGRKDKVTVIAGVWVCFSAVLLAVIGWGAVENGEILYFLYFGWAFLVLLFRLAEWMADRLRLPLFTVVASGAAIAALCFVNCRGVWQLWDFAFTYYPLR